MQSIIPGHRPVPIRRTSIGAVLIWTASLAANPAAAATLPSEQVLTLALAQEAVAAALQACEDQGYRVSVAVVDRSGRIKAQLRGDGAGPHTLDSSRKKAYTALSLRHATSDLVALIQKRPEAAGLKEMNAEILILGGGLPIAAGEEVIGGIGVGGAPGGHLDESCAKAGIDKIRNRLR
ncbi:MAG: heme-binding protein [Kiloniellaceae bacterium]